LIELDKKQWESVYKDVLLLAVRIARSKDRAYEATQQAFERCLRVRPPVESVEELSKYLKGAMRSALGHGYRETHKDYESAAATEHAVVSGGASPSAEEANLEAGDQAREERRIARRTENLMKELENDPIARGTVECIAEGIDEPAEQARILKRSVDEIYKARKRRNRAVERVLAAEKDGASAAPAAARSTPDEGEDDPEENA
jgi:hypothetical protein